MCGHEHFFEAVHIARIIMSSIGTNDKNLHITKKFRKFMVV